jgi:pimeloyl-ACP methyl ester carboxylesterase
MPYAEVNDIRLYFEESGPAAGVPLVLMHGGTGSIDDAETGWADLAPSFAERYHVVAIEHRGHGRTDNPAGRITFDLLVEDLAAVLLARGLAPAHLAGVSDGAIVALQMAMTRPGLVRAVVAVGANYHVDATIASFLDGATPEAIERAMPEWAVDLARRHDRSKGPGAWRKLVRQVAENARTSPSFTTEDLGRIAAPTLLIAGENDPFANLDQMVGMKCAIPGAEWLIINDAGHTPQHSHPWIVGPRVLDFLERYEGATFPAGGGRGTAAEPG